MQGFNWILWANETQKEKEKVMETVEEIIDLFKLTKEEVRLIENTIALDDCSIYEYNGVYVTDNYPQLFQKAAIAYNLYR